MGSRICSVPDCGKPVIARGWCSRCYRRWQRHGTVEHGPALTVEGRFWEKVNKTETCWLWTAYRAKNGYGTITVGGRPRLAHRFAYELLVGPIPEGLTLDHVKANGCTSRACVKAIADEFGPAHLEPVTMAENLRRGPPGGWTPGSLAARTHCRRRHPFDEANTMVDRNGTRRCRTCHVQARDRLYLLQRDEINARRRAEWAARKLA